MSGLRTFQTLDPNHWRFPQWVPHVYYPVGAFVAYYEPTLVDSETTVSFWVASTEVDIWDSENIDHVPKPTDSDAIWANRTNGVVTTNPWLLSFSPNDQLNKAEIKAFIDALTPLLDYVGLDSDIRVLQEMDSDFEILINDNDSEINRQLDSEIHDRKAGDSDIHDRLDSEYRQRNDRDSDLGMRLDSEYHDRKAGDSDLNKTLRRDWDSDLDASSDSDRHDFHAEDSDLRVELLHVIDEVDSDIRVEILRLDHRIDSDSERLIHAYRLLREFDSDIHNELKDHDSDIEYLKLFGAGNQSNGYMAGAIMTFASVNMPTGFRLCDGSIFDEFVYPDLFKMLGTNVLPDLRGQFLRGWSDDNSVDVEGPRPPLTTQDDDVGPHNHQYRRFEMSIDGGQSTPATNNDARYAWQATATNTSSGETRPTNVAVAYGIAMYNGAGVVTDSDLIESVLRIRMKDWDSDVRALYDLTTLRTETYEPTADAAPGWIYTIDEPISNYTDVVVYLNGVSVFDFTTSGGVFTFNFYIRGNTDSIHIRMRR